MPWLINAAQLDKFRKDQKNVVVLDATYFLPTDNRDAKAEYQQKHVGGARFFDITEFNDTTSSLPNLLTRDEALISQKLGELGITPDHKVIFYDNSSLHTSCRALWMFKVFGHNSHQLYILDGGFAAWEKFGGKVESGVPQVASRQYGVNFESHYIRTLVQMKTNLHHPAEQVVDVRHPVRFAGGKEHRAGLRSGHIPGAYSFPYFTMFEQEGTFKPLDKIRRQFVGIGIDLNTPIVTMCGSGVSSAVLNFVLDLMNHNQHALYNGSWSEWGADTLYHGEENLAERPVVTSLE
jgi:thiosulfate/3-mercaptopyruvate sulfurtransferase